MLSCIRHGVVLWGPDHRLLASNAIADELLDHPPGLLAPGQTRGTRSSRACWRVAISARAPARRNGPRTAGARPVDALLRQIVTPAGRVLDVRSDPTPAGGWVTTFTDVTEARAAEDELRRAKEAAEAANQAKSRFLATMSHELRTPLNAVIGFSDALLREAANPSPAQVAEFAAQINEAGRQLLGLINIILDVARIESGPLRSRLRPVDVARLVRHCARLADAAAQAAEITLIAEVPDDLPPLRADERRLQQVLNHLLSNAVKFTEAGGTVSVGAALETDGGCCCSCAIPGSASRRRISSASSSRSPSSTAACRGASRAPASASMCRARWWPGMAASSSLRSAPGQGTIGRDPPARRTGDCGR